jgi:VWFA-related protein
MKRTLALVSALLTMVVLSALAQDLLVNVNLTMLSAFVEDQNGHPVLDLTADDFEILENGRVKPVEHFSLQQEPIAVGLVVDMSSSIDLARKELDRAATKVLEAFDPADAVFLMTFAGASKLDVALTKRHKTIAERIRKRKLAFGTRFYDVIIDSLQYLATSGVQHKALIVFSDGADHYSFHTFGEVLEVAKSYGYPIYLLGYAGDDPRMWSEGDRREVRDQFQQIARITGGTALFPAPGTDCSGLASDILNAVGHAYKLGFYSSEPFTSSVNVQLRLRGARSTGLRVRVLRGSIPISGLVVRASVRIA